MLKVSLILARDSTLRPSGNRPSADHLMSQVVRLPRGAAGSLRRLMSLLEVILE